MTDSFHDAVGEWIPTRFDDSSEWDFVGYTVQPSIGDRGDIGRCEPSVVGVSYRPADTKTAIFDFQYTVVEIVGSPTEGVSGGDVRDAAQTLDDVWTASRTGNTAADFVTGYIAVPGSALSEDVTSLPQDPEFGMVAIESTDDGVRLEERFAPTSKSVTAIGVLSNSDLNSKGYFKDGVARSSVLERVLTPETFFDEVIRPAQQAYDDCRKYEAAFKKVKSDPARVAMRDLIGALQERAAIDIEPRSSNPLLVVTTPDNEECLVIRPQNETFKIRLWEGDTVFRIADRNSIKSFGVNETTELSEVVDYLVDEVIPA
jgi:hypothetical protein